MIGLTTGVSYKTKHPLSREVIDMCYRISPDAIEVNCIGSVHDGTLCMLNKIPETALTRFKHISLHAPSKRMKYRDDAETRKILNQIQLFSDRMGVACVVVHPDNVEDWKVFREYTFPLAVENMDRRKKAGTTIEGLTKIFNITNSLFVLDITHCFSIDPTLSLAMIFLKNFQDRLCEIHLSGFAGYHELLHETRQLKMLEVITETDVPIIIESACSNEVSAQKEYDYIKMNFELIKKKITVL